MSRLPFSPERPEGRRIDLRNDRLPVRFSHPVREIDQYIDDIVYNAISLIQERETDNPLRTFYFNMMSDRDYDNRDFEQLIEMIGDVLDIGLQEGRIRDVRDGIIAVTEDIVMMHIGYMVDEYRELWDFVPERMTRDIERAIDQFQRHLKAVDIFRRNGRSTSARNRDRYDDRDRGGARFGSDRGGRFDRSQSRRDQWDRGAVRGGVHGSPRRGMNRENRFGNSDQSDRFEDLPDARRTNNDRYDNRDDRNAGRYEQETGRSYMTRRDTENHAHIQKLPGRPAPVDDVTDALAREEGSTMQEVAQNDNQDVASIAAAENLDAWLPSVNYPHPLVINYQQELIFDMFTAMKHVGVRVAEKKEIVDYYSHDSMAFGKTPRDFKRYEDVGIIEQRQNALHSALLNPTETFNVNDTDQEITYHNRADFTELNFMSYSMKDVLVRLAYRRLSMERGQPNGDKYHPVEISVGKASLIDSFVATEEEAGYMEELRGTGSFTKLVERMKFLNKHLRAELWLQLDRYFTDAVNHFRAQYLSIPCFRIDSFTEDWLELFALITKDFGEGYRDAINTFQEREIRHLLNYDQNAEIFVLSQMPEQVPGIKPFIVSMPTKLIHVNEISYNLNIDMIPGVGSQILPEANPFFYDLAKDVLTSGADQYSRYFIQTADLRIIEASRSWMNDKAILLRVVK